MLVSLFSSVVLGVALATGGAAAPAVLHADSCNCPCPCCPGCDCGAECDCSDCTCCN